MELTLASKIMIVLVAGLLIWFLFRYIRSNPEALSWENLNKSFYSMGLLAVGLIVFITVVVMLLRHG